MEHPCLVEELNSGEHVPPKGSKIVRCLFRNFFQLFSERYIFCPILEMFSSVKFPFDEVGEQKQAIVKLFQVTQSSVSCQCLISGHYSQSSTSHDEKRKK